LAVLVRLATVLALCGALGLGATGCGDGPSKDSCEQLLDHILEIEIRAAGTGQLTPEMKADLDAQKKEVKTNLQQPFMSQCLEKTPSRFVSCGLKAKSHEELAACERS
jgi:hypothetical protein